MNKYLKILMLSGGVIGAVAPTAMDFDGTSNNDLGGIYEQVEKMQQVLPRLSRIKYNLNIDLDTNKEENNETYVTPSENSEITNELVNDEVNNDTITNEEQLNNEVISSIDNNESDDYIGKTSTENNQISNNITFTTTDQDGNETVLNNTETINYLSETLNQTNIEYEELKNTLNKAIKDTMDYLDSYKNGETTLNNEQKMYIKEHTNSIKYLAETLEDLSEQVICCIDGCEDCDEEDFESTTSKYLTTIQELETRIETLNSAISALQFLNNIGNPFFFRPSPNHIIYGYNYNSQNDDLSDLDNNTESSNENQQENDETVETTNDSVQNNDDTQGNVSESNGENTAEDEKTTTFGLKSNIDTYAPSKRNIDTFFNTALQNNNYGYGNGYGYGMPYGYGAMPYQGYYSNPYNTELNSNLINRSTIENQQGLDNTNNEGASEKKSNEHKKFRIKRAKNIDSYSGTTIKSNINSMGESKISRFFKDKFSDLRNKIKNRNNRNNEETYFSKNQEKNVENNILNDNYSNIADTEVQNSSLEILEDNNSSPIPSQEKEVKASK